MTGLHHTAYAAPARLARFVASAWSLEAPAGADPLPCPVFPDASVALLFGGGRWTRTGGQPVATAADARLGVLGVLTRRWGFALEPGGWLAGVNLRLGAAASVLGLPAREWTNALQPLDGAWGDAARALERRLQDTRTPAAAIALLLDAVADRLQTAPPWRPSWVELVETSGGRATVDALAHASGLSRQHLARRARHDVGVAPKLACRLTRFQYALGLAASGRKIDWAAAATALGYYDQAHLIAEFREFAEASPSQL